MNWKEYHNYDNNYNNVPRVLSLKKKFICPTSLNKIHLLNEETPIWVPGTLGKDVNLYAALAFSRWEITGKDISAFPSAFVSYNKNIFLDYHNIVCRYGTNSQSMKNFINAYGIDEKTRIKLQTMCNAINIIAPLDLIVSYKDENKFKQSSTMFKNLSEMLVCDEFYIQRQFIANNIDF